MTGALVKRSISGMDWDQVCIESQRLNFAEPQLICLTKNGNKNASTLGFPGELNEITPVKHLEQFLEHRKVLMCV